MIRVLRLLEYIYQDYEQAEDDMKRWQIPQFGSKSVTPTKTIYSAILPPTTELMKDENKGL